MTTLWFAAETEQTFDIKKDASIISVSDDLSLRFSAWSVSWPSKLTTSTVAWFWASTPLDWNVYKESTSPVYYKLIMQDSSWNPVELADTQNIITFNNSAWIENPVILKYSEKDWFTELKYDQVSTKLYATVSWDISWVYSIVEKIWNDTESVAPVINNEEVLNTEPQNDVLNENIFNTQTDVAWAKENMLFAFFTTLMISGLFFIRKIKQS